ncbi:MAG: acyl-CoA thioesterase [Bacteroidetes bacterium]|nr:acyl-CoA thioesterase [Bacteroidota bacterium]MBI3482248.1 acyl-CoA thioesterase [Bacteroidota bacterium]
MENESSKPLIPPVFDYTIGILPEDIDELGHVNNVIYLRWVQQVAAAHWNSKAARAITDNYFWVVLRHEIDYLKPALLNDKITAHTWVSSMEGAKSVRHVKFFANGNALAYAKTVWCLLDASTMKPKRIGDDIKSIFT